MQKISLSGIGLPSLLVGLSLLCSATISGQADVQRPGQVRLLYTGKSLGVLGYMRYQEEHELLTEVAVRDSIDFKLVSHLCWRAPGVTIFLPSDEPLGHELDIILAARPNMSVVEDWPAFRTNNVLILQDPEKMRMDMMQVVRDNPRTYRDFPDIEETVVNVYSVEIEDDEKRALVVETPGATWPEEKSAWIEGEINRVDFAKGSDLFELPLNHGYFGNRAAVIERLESEAPQEVMIVKADLGHHNGDFDLAPEDRGDIDFSGVDALGYEMIVPYEFDLTLGVEKLHELKVKYPDLTFIASNVASDSIELLSRARIIQVNGVQIGFVGLVDPSLKINLPRPILDQFRFLPVEETVQVIVDSLRAEGASAVIALSNMQPEQNALLAENTRGIDVVISNLTGNAAIPETNVTVEFDEARALRPGRPHLVANAREFGATVGQLDLEFQSGRRGRPYLSSVQHQLHRVVDSDPSDVELMNTLTSGVERVKREKGDLMFPAFVDIIEQVPSLQNFDQVTQNGRVSKELWEHFMARLIRQSAPAEVSLIRPVTAFPPLIGKLHEREVRSWLWIEDEMVLLDMKGADIARLMESPLASGLVTSGISSFKFRGRYFYYVMGRWMINDAYYRVATTNVIYEGALNEYFINAIRVRQQFRYDHHGRLKKDKDGTSVTQRDYVLQQLQRVRSQGKGKTHHRNIANILQPDPRFERLFSFRFQNPTLWSSLNRVYKGDGYESVPESRINAANSFVIGVSGGMILTFDQRRSAIDWTVNFGFAQLRTQPESGGVDITENQDDLVLSMSYRYKGNNFWTYQPLARAEYDTEFTPTINADLGEKNLRQSIMRGILGITREPSRKWSLLEGGVTYEFDLASRHAQFGLRARTRARFPLDKNWRVVYSLTNNFDYYFPTNADTERELSIRYNMINELSIPLFGELSLTLAADFFLFRGKLETNNDVGLSMLYRVGVTYNRIWKPRFQSFL